MARFKYVTQNAKGAPFVRAFADASSLADLNTRLQNLNKPVVEVIDLPGKDSPRKSPRVSLRTKLTFLEQLEASSYLGMDFRTSLGICLRTTSGRTRQGRQMIRVIGDLREKVSGGLSFARAIKSYPHVFDEVAVGLILAGEEGGTFSEALTNVRKIWTRDEDLQHRLLMLLIYPAIVLAAALGVVWLLVTRVVPQFIHVLGEMNLALPLPTRILLGLSHFVSAYPFVPLVVSMAVVLLFLELPSFVRATPVLHGVALRLPGIGKLFAITSASQFLQDFRSTETCQGQNDPNVDSLSGSQLEL
jgi:type II secretory pathway component PulF